MLEFELFVAVLLLAVIVVLVSVLIHKVSEGFRITFNYLEGIKGELIDSANRCTEDDGEE